MFCQDQVVGKSMRSAPFTILKLEQEDPHRINQKGITTIRPKLIVRLTYCTPPGRQESLDKPLPWVSGIILIIHPTGLSAGYRPATAWSLSVQAGDAESPNQRDEHQLRMLP